MKFSEARKAAREVEWAKADELAEEAERKTPTRPAKPNRSRGSLHLLVVRE
jgi:hypothetical protein